MTDFGVPFSHKVSWFEHIVKEISINKANNSFTNYSTIDQLKIILRLCYQLMIATFGI